MSNEIPEIIRRALVETVCDIGQITTQEKRILNKYIKRGWLSKGKGGPFPMMKTMYAHRDFDFVADREREVEHAMALAELDAQVLGQGYHARRSRKREVIRWLPL